jgi:Zn-dependent M28 family amino/carboxypeptidase/peroxiredoxin
MGIGAGALLLLAGAAAAGDGAVVGQPAPEAQLRDSKDTALRLASLTGRRCLVAFFPRDYTPNSTVELERLRDHYAEFSDRGIAVLGVSLDPAPSHARFRAALKLPFDLLSDPGGAAARAFGVFVDDLGGYARRSVFLLDEKGVITYADPQYDVRTDADWEALLAALGPRPAGNGLISADEYRKDLQKLASDEFEGRGIGARGEETTVAWLSRQLSAARFEPGVGGSFEQPVPLLRMKNERPPELAVGGRSLKFLDDFVVFTHRQEPEVAVVDAPLLFVGYGCAAPEYKWDDFKGVDCKGSVLVVLVGDPPLSDDRFGGPALTYYGRWTYKFEEAARRGAAGVLLVHETDPASYPWEVVRNSWGADNYDFRRDGRGASRCAFEAWIQRDVAASLLQAAGKDFGALKASAATDDFKPVALGVTATCRIAQKLEPLSSRNVVGVFPGGEAGRTVAEAEKGDEWLILCAHWDHFGRDDSLQGDAIYNGAVDNASGCCGILALARALARAPTRPRRSVMALFVTGEERGLLGSQWYCDHPVVPLEKTAAVINLDGMNVLGRTRDLAIIGMGQSTLEDLLGDAITAQHRRIVPDPTPEQGRFFRSDQLSFARKGVPALFIGAGVDYLDRPDGWGLAQRKRYTAELYHKVKDEFDPAWNFDGAVEDLSALYAVAQHVLNDPTTPSWRESSEFRALRVGSPAPAGK